MASPREDPGHGAFRFLDLPPDLKMNIIEELLGPSIASIRRKRLNKTQSTPFRIQNQPRLQLNILRVSKDVFAIADTVLRSINKWITFDIDCSHLLLPQATHAVPFIIVDRNEEATLPHGILRVRLHMYIKHEGGLNIAAPDWPDSVPKRQLFLVHVANLELFLQELRIMELIYALRCKPGCILDTLGTGSLREIAIVQPGLHGLQIRVNVHGGVPTHRMQSLLELFRMFHGQLNEVSTFGFEKI